MVPGSTQSIAFGAPNIYRAQDELRRTLGAERMDVCAFTGVAPRGPCRMPEEPEACQQNQIYLEPDRKRRRSVAVAVESWDDYLRLYGGFEGPGRLPYAVAAFFEQGGQRAYVTRIVHEYSSDENLQGLSRAEVTQLNSSSGAVTLRAKNEGSWGNQLKAALGYHVQPMVLLAGSTAAELRVSAEENYPVGTLLRLTVQPAGLSPGYEFRFVTQQGKRGIENSSMSERFLLLNTAVDEIPIYAEVVEADLLLLDGQGFQEHFTRLGLSADHPRWLAGILYRESELVNPEHQWLNSTLLPGDAHDVPAESHRSLIDKPIIFSGGEDRYESIQHADFFDHTWVPGNPLPGDGIHALTHLQDLSLLVIPDLYVPEPLPDAIVDDDTVSLAGANFTSCIDLQITEEPLEQIIPGLPGLLLDPSVAVDLAEIIRLQQQVVELAELLQGFIVLLDVPPGINQQAILSWRSHFYSAFCASYYPWINISKLDDQRDSLILLNPSAVAAGIIAHQGLTFGVPHGPANVIARGVVKVDEKISPQRHDQLHPLGINVFLPQRDGVWLSAARTLSGDQRYRQLSVRRLMTMLQRVLIRQMMWVVFEPNHPSLWATIRHMLNNFLRQLFIAGAFKGRTEEQAFFVRCDGELNDRRVLDAGQLIVEIGVAPSEPLEFIVVHIVRGGDGTLLVES